MENTEEKKYCVYMHISPSGKRYIGITGVKPEKRWGNGKRYNGNSYFWHAIQKYGLENFQHIILYQNLTKEEAEQLEINLIAYYKSNQRDFGYNIANGGNTIGKMSDETRQKISEANKGKVVSDDTRQKLSDIRKECWEDDDYRQNQIEKHKWQTGENHPWFGKHHSEETKEKISQKAKDRFENDADHPFHNKRNLSGGNNPFYGKTHSEETKQKISEANSGEKSGRARKIIQYDKQGNFIKIWGCIKDASISLNINYCSIVACCNGRQNKAGGFIWRYASVNEEMELCV